MSFYIWNVYNNCIIKGFSLYSYIIIQITGQTALCMAAEKNEIGIIDILLQHGANSKFTDKYGKRAWPMILLWQWSAHYRYCVYMYNDVMTAAFEDCTLFSYFL